MIRARILSVAAVWLAVAAWHAAAPRPAGAAEVEIFDRSVPAPADLARVLWPQASGGGGPAASPTRSIRLKEPGSEAAPEPPRAFAFLVRFAFDSAEVLPESRPYLDSVGGMLRLPEAEGRRVAIVGHTDASGAGGYNRWLSERRAAAVRGYLRSRFGIAPERLEAVGKGEDAPLPGLDPAEPRNRRVEFHAAP
jgi:outer membrane protein OmpA-like peptidoglycan-associated protein